MVKEFKFGKRERLSNKIQIERLFKAGRSFLIYPFKIFFMAHENPQHVEVKIIVAISKKKFKKANERNRIRRKIKEAYRLNKNILLEKKVALESGLNLGIVYVSDNHNPDYHYLEEKLVQCLTQLSNIIT